MIEKTYETPSGVIHYWICKNDLNTLTLVFLPGLTADHRLFDKQIEYFKQKYNVFVWDAPGHAASWPFAFDFDLMDKARWLNEILSQEKIDLPVIIGQSMGGYVGQAYAQLYPEKLKGFVSIDSAPLQRKYVTGIEIWLLKRMEPVYLYYPWKSLLKTGTNGVATSSYGRKLMYDVIGAGSVVTKDIPSDVIAVGVPCRVVRKITEEDKKRYARLSGHGFKILAKAMEKDLPYKIQCPALLICGEKDHAGSCIRYNKAWHKDTGIPIVWIQDAGHNSNTDKPETVNRLIEDLLIEIHN